MVRAGIGARLWLGLVLGLGYGNRAGTEVRLWL